MAGQTPDDIDPVWHALPAEQVLRHFGVDPQRGLPTGEVQRAQARFGPNTLPEPPPMDTLRGVLK